MFESLFKYPLADFQQGEFVLPWLLWLVAIALVAVVVFLFYAWLGKRIRLADRFVLTALRTALLTVVFFSLLQPVLVLSRSALQRGVLGVLLDDSRSMRIADGANRASFIQQQFDSEQGELLAALQEKFEPRLFSFAANVTAIDDVSQLRFNGGKTNLTQALDETENALAGTALAAVLVVSDGADNGHADLERTLLNLRARSVPVYVLGLGQERFSPDIELSRVKLPHTLLNGSAALAELSIRQQGYTGTRVELRVEDDGRIIHSQDIELDSEEIIISTPLTLEESGPRRLLFQLALQDGEIIGQNNSREALVQVTDRTERILYVEGEPRFELKFIRRAVHDDDNLHIVSLLRTAENKFYRLGLDDPDELSEGFPKTREELFKYRGLILGSVEASFFSREQQQLIVDFVNERGGGLLFLGGKRAFAEGGYADTPLADVLPVLLGTKADTSFAREVAIRPTSSGAAHPIIQLADKNAEHWNQLPTLTMVNPIYRSKPGATVLLSGIDGDSEPLVTLALQRYGRGQVIAFAVQNAWLWQMHPDIDLEDQTHEHLWRQLLRWLVRETPERLQLSTPTRPVAPGETVTLGTEVFDKAYRPHNQTQVRALLTSPTGQERELTLSRTLDRPGAYQAEFVPEEQGLYELRVNASDSDDWQAEAEAFIEVSDNAHEYHQAQLRTPLLERIAAQTGGGFFTPDKLDDLVGAIPQAQSGALVTERRELWDMPILLLLMITLVSAEWAYRRWRGLV